MERPAIIWTEEEWKKSVVDWVLREYSDLDRVTQIRMMELMASLIVVGQSLGDAFMQNEVLKRRRSEYDSMGDTEGDRNQEFQKKMRTESKMKLVGILYSGAPEDQCRLESLSYYLASVYSCPGFDSKLKEMKDNDGMKFGRVFFELKAASLFRANGMKLKFLSAKGKKICEFCAGEDVFIECKQPDGEVTSITPLASPFSNYLEDMVDKVPTGGKGILFIWMSSRHQMNMQTRRHVEQEMARAYKQVVSSSLEILDRVAATILVNQFFRETEEDGISTVSLEYEIVAPIFEGTEYRLLPEEIKRAINLVEYIPIRKRWIINSANDAK